MINPTSNLSSLDSEELQEGVQLVATLDAGDYLFLYLIRRTVIEKESLRIAMKNLPGIPGTCGGLLLRVGQFLFAAASVVVMVTGEEFSSYTAFCYLVAAMGLQFLWSFGLATLDAYALLIKRGLRNPVLVSLFVVGDWVTATLSFAAACSTAGVAVLFDNDLGYCAQTDCRRYQISASLAFASWLLIGLSSLITFRLLATG